MRKSNELSEDRVKAVRAKLPQAVREMLPRDLSTVVEDIEALHLLAARMDAESAALTAAAQLRYKHGETVDSSDLREELAREKRRADSLEVSNREKDEHIMHLRSIPAQAVHS